MKVLTTVGRAETDAHRRADADAAPPEARRWTRGAVPIAALLLVLLGAVYLRTAELGRDPFNVDELFQFFAAESLHAGEGPLLPSSEPYTRGIDLTRLVAALTGHFGTSEIVVRSPSLVLGLLNVALFAGILWAIGGPWVAVWGSALLAIHPEAVYQSRYLRFYTYQLCFGLVAFYASWRALRPAGTRDPPDASRMRAQWAWTALAILAFALATRVQVVTLSVVAGWAACVAAAAAADLYRHGVHVWRRSMPVQLAAIGLLAGVAFLTLQTELALALVRRSQHVADWARPAAGVDLAYYYMLVEDHPVLVATTPLIFLFVAMRRMRLAVFLGLWFAVPLFLHSFVFPWKGGRFVLLALPALFSAAAVAAALGSGALFDSARRWLRRRGPRLVGRDAALAAVIVGLCASAVLVTSPALSKSRQLVSEPFVEDWKAIRAIRAERPELAALPIGGRSPLHLLHYWGRADFKFVASDTDLWVEPVSVTGSLRSDLQDADSVRVDWHAAVPIVPTPQGVGERFADAGTVLLVLSVPDDVFATEIGRAAFRTGRDLCDGRCGDLALLRWELPSEVEELDVR